MYHDGIEPERGQSAAAGSGAGNPPLPVQVAAEQSVCQFVGFGAAVSTAGARSALSDGTVPIHPRADASSVETT